MYDVPRFYLVDNVINRYSIADRTAGLVTDDDGAGTTYLQHDRPDRPEEAANWPPTPRGPFRPILRMYQPQPSATEGEYQLPPIVRQLPDRAACSACRHVVTLAPRRRVRRARPARWVGCPSARARPAVAGKAG